MAAVFFFGPLCSRASVAQLVNTNWLSSAGDTGADLVIGLIRRTDWIHSNGIVKLTVHGTDSAVFTFRVVASVVGDAAAARIGSAQVDAVLVGHDVGVETAVGLRDLLAGVRASLMSGEPVLITVLADVRPNSEIVHGDGVSEGDFTHLGALATGNPGIS